jgi:hypothetical protein
LQPGFQELNSLKQDFVGVPATKFEGRAVEEVLGFDASDLHKVTYVDNRRGFFIVLLLISGVSGLEELALGHSERISAA